MELVLLLARFVRASDVALHGLTITVVILVPDVGCTLRSAKHSIPRVPEK